MKNGKIKPRAEISTIPCWCRFDEEVDITQLVGNPRNANYHPEKQIALLAKIIRHQGWRQPITISNRSGFVVKGHGRLEAAKLLQVEFVPVEYQDYESEAAEYADLLADNRIAELSEQNQDLIADLLADGMFDDFDTDLTGFDSDELGMFDVEAVEPPDLASGDKEPFRQMTITLHDSQFEVVDSAINKAKAEGGSKSDVNENSNGNAIAFVCERFLNG